MNSRVKSKIMLCLASLSVIFNVGQGMLVGAATGEEPKHCHGHHRRHHAGSWNFAVPDMGLDLSAEGINAIRDGLGNTQLHRAVLWHDIGRVNALLDAGANCDLLNNYGATALHIAVSTCQDNMVETLLRHGANPNIVGSEFGSASDSRRDIPLAFVRRHEGAQRDTAALRIRDLLLRAGSESRPFENASFVPEDLDDLPLHMAPPPTM